MVVPLPFEENIHEGDTAACQRPLRGPLHMQGGAMSTKAGPAAIHRRPDVYVGLMFMAIAGLGLYLAKDYSMGTAVRMGTGYVPTLLCWTLMTLGAVILGMGLFGRNSSEGALTGKDLAVLKPLFFVTLAVIVFAYSIETLGLIIALLATMTIGSFATSSLRWIEAIVAMVALTIVCWAVFSIGLALPFPVWPRF